jgi:hypothetical protein
MSGAPGRRKPAGSVWELKHAAHFARGGFRRKFVRFQGESANIPRFPLDPEGAAIACRQPFASGGYGMMARFNGHLKAVIDCLRRFLQQPEADRRIAEDVEQMGREGSGADGTWIEDVLDAVRCRGCSGPRKDFPLAGDRHGNAYAVRIVEFRFVPAFFPVDGNLLARGQWVRRIAA